MWIDITNSGFASIVAQFIDAFFMRDVSIEQ